MSRLNQPKPVRLIMGIIFAPGARIGECMEKLAREFGEEVFRSDPGLSTARITTKKRWERGFYAYSPPTRDSFPARP